MNAQPASPDLQAVVIGASAGAVQTLLRLLPALPRQYPLAVLVVVHLPPFSESSLAALLAGHCQVRVKEAEDKETITPGVVYLAPPNYHLLVEPDRLLSLSSDEPVLFSRPSIDVLFESAADAYGSSVAGVILTGANSDGARGLRAILDAGGLGLVQSPAGAEAQAMPAAALAACPEARSLDLQELAQVLKTELPLLRRR